MNKIFVKILPLAAAVLLVTSCGESGKQANQTNQTNGTATEGKTVTTDTPDSNGKTVTIACTTNTFPANYVWGSEDKATRTYTVTSSVSNGANITWASDNESIAKIDKGVVTIVGCGGTAKISATVDGVKSNEIEISVDSYVKLNGLEWAKENLKGTYKFSDRTENWPTSAEWSELFNNCYCEGTEDGCYVFKLYDNDEQSDHEYSTTSGDPYILLPNEDYWTSTVVEGDEEYAFIQGVNPDYWKQRDEEIASSPELMVRTVRRSK